MHTKSAIAAHASFQKTMLSAVEGVVPGRQMLALQLLQLLFIMPGHRESFGRGRLEQEIENQVAEWLNDLGVKPEALAPSPRVQAAAEVVDHAARA